MAKTRRGRKITVPKSSDLQLTGLIILFISILIDALIKIGRFPLWFFKKVLTVLPVATNGARAKIIWLSQNANAKTKQLKRKAVKTLLKKRNTLLLVFHRYKNLLKIQRPKTKKPVKKSKAKTLTQNYIVVAKQWLNEFSSNLKKVHQKFIIDNLRLLADFRNKVGLLFKRPVTKPVKKIIRKKEKVIYRRLGKLTKLKYFLIGISAALILVVLPLTLYFWLKELPNPRTLSTRDIAATTKIYDRNGKLLYQIYSQENRTLVKLSDIPLSLREATIAIEDQDFYHHLGINWKGVVRASLVDLKSGNVNGRPLQGGSSITQQLIKSALLTSDPTIARKIKEMILAIWAERIYSKNQILEMYFNQVPYGGTAWGIEAASETYFGKKVSRLDLAESAILAGLPAAPTYYSPFGAHPQLAKQRQAEVLRRMVEDKYITQDEADRAGKEKLDFAPQTTEIKAPHFVMYVKELLVQKYGERMVEQGGLNVITSLDLNVQDTAQDIVTSQIEQLQNLQITNGAALVTNPITGEILAMVGSRDYFDTSHDGNVNVTLSLRQPGSSIKPIMYAAALQHGFTPATIIDDGPVSFNIPGQPPYQPVNYDGKWHGRVTLKTALANSLNIPAVKVLNAIGVNTMLDMAKKMGISTWKDPSQYGLSLTLGGGDVTMLDMAKAYGVLANSGNRVDLKPILKVTNYRGDVLEDDSQNEETPVLPPEIAYILSGILADNNARAMEFGLNSALNIPGKIVSVKTGTTDNKRDNWTIGYTPFYLVAVWVGNNDNSPMNQYLASGITGAAPIWHEIMAGLLKDKETPAIPATDNMVAVPVCALNGMLPCEGCPTIIDYFIKGTQPTAHCEKITATPTPTP